MTNETTTVVSLAGAALIATLPKLLDLFLGEKIARRRDETDRLRKLQDAESAYSLALLNTAREGQAQLLQSMRERIQELEETQSGTTRHAKPTDPKGNP